MNVSTSFFRVIVIISCVCFPFSPTQSLAKISHLTILHTNNHHGHFARFSLPDNPEIGGMAARSTLINIVRTEVEQAGGNVLLLSAGGVNIGTPESDLLYAEPDFKLMKLLGYDAMALGLNEFNNPREVLLKQREWAGFPFLSANIVKKDTGQLLEFVEPYIIKTFDGLTVAIFGLLTEATPNITIYTKDLITRSVIETAKNLVPKLRKKADIVIALTHIGFFGVSREPGDVQLARAVPGINVIVSGVVDGIDALEEPEIADDTVIVQAGVYGLSVGRLDLTIDTNTDSITDFTYHRIPVNLKQKVNYQGKSYYRYVDQGYLEDPVVLEFIAPYLKHADDLLSQPVGETLVTLTGDPNVSVYQETNLANLISDSMRAKTGAEIAFLNPGAIGLDADIAPGPIIYRDILDILPYGNTLVLLDMTGEQVMNVLRVVATRQRFFYVSGLTWTNKKGFPEDVLVGGTPIELERIYKVVTTSYLAGKEGYIFEDLPQFDTGFVNASALREYIQKAGTIAPKIEGRRVTIME